MIAETTAAGQTLVEYFYLGDQPLAMIRPGETEAVYYYHNDHLGTPQILTSESQSIAWKAAYTPFGEAEVLVGIVENNLRFPGQYYDQETGLHYNWNRYYDPKTGRYLTPDPIGLEGGINLFPYAANNPVNEIDPEGLFMLTDCPKCWEYQDRISKATEECRSDMAACKTDEDLMKFADKYGSPLGPEEALYNCVKHKTGDANIWQKMKESCAKCGFLRGIRIWRTPILPYR